MPVESNINAKLSTNPAEEPKAGLPELAPPDREVPEELLKAMRGAVPIEEWPGTECRLRRAFNLRLEQSEEVAQAWLKPGNGRISLPRHRNKKITDS
jgi:hypothetical protein